jgi:hypothetical protein
MTSTPTAPAASDRVLVAVAAAAVVAACLSFEREDIHA